MRDVAVFTRVQRRVMALQACTDVVGAQDGDFGGLLQTFWAHHAAVHPADRQHRRIAQWCCRNGADTVYWDARGGMTGQVRHQVGYYANRAYTGAAAAVRNAKSLVQVQVTDVATKLAGRGHTDQGIHVGTVDIDPATMQMHQCAKLFHMGFKHAMGAGVSDHHAGQLVAVLLALRFQISHVHIALGIASGDHHRHANHLRAGRVGAMR